MTKFLRLYIVVASVTQGLLRSNFLRIWVFLELRTLSYLFYLFSDRENFIFKEGIKLFLIQALRGLLILISLLQLELLQSEPLTFFTVLIIIFKIGAAPFYGWLLRLINQLSWNSFFVFITAIKFIPLIILRNLNFSFLEVFRVLGFIGASYIRLYLRNLKCLVLASSLFFLRILFTILSARDYWFQLLVIYSSIFFLLRGYFSLSDGELSRNQLQILGGGNRFIGPMLLINLAGLPPLPGFFLKVLWLLTTEARFFLLLVFTISSVLIMYIYLSFALKSLVGFSAALSRVSLLVRLKATRAIIVFILSSLPLILSL